jgi:hypothetical protein
MYKSISINITDTGDNYPIHYKVSSATTKGGTAGWHLVELLDETFDKEFTFRYDMIDDFIEALQEIKKVVKE